MQSDYSFCEEFKKGSLNSMRRDKVIPPDVLFMAVNYTRLTLRYCIIPRDIYERPVEGPVGFTPVSYTHLDVYKRQM